MTKYTSIIIPVLNAEKTIKKCLDAIFNINTPKEQFEVILVDNGSKDRTIEIAEKYDIKIYKKPDATISTLRNFGAHKSRGDIFGFVDSDCIVSENWLNSALQHFDDEKIGIVGAHYTIPDNCNWVGRAWDILSEKRNIEGEIDQLPGGNMLISKLCHERIKGFDEQLVTCEDVDLCYRAKKEGFKVYSDPYVKVIHLGDCISLWKFFKKEIWRGQEVIRIYLHDRRPTNLKASVFALFYLTLLLMIGFSGLYIALFGKGFIIFMVSILLFLGTPFLLSYRAIQKTSKKQFLFHVAIIFSVFGTARALAICKNLKRG